MLKEQTISTQTAILSSELGKLLDGIARERNIRGPYNVAKWVTDITGYRISGQAISRLFCGASRPKPDFILAFSEAFDLSFEERDRLAWLYIYRQLPDESLSSP